MIQEIRPKIWLKLVKNSDRYSADHEDFIEMFAKIQSMWDEHLGLINVSKHCIELVNEENQLVYLARYRIEPKAWEHEISEIVKILAYAE